MTENSVIKHYKKQLIFRQNDVPDQKNDEKKDTKLVKEVVDNNNKIYDFVEPDLKNNNNNNKIDKNCINNGKKIRRKRKNKNCRGQFRHEGMELIKLGTNTSHSLCKTKEAYIARIEKPQSELIIPNKKDENQKKAENLEETNKKSVIQSNFVDKTIILEETSSKELSYGHPLPQMVPERRNSREIVNPTKVPSVVYRSPPHIPVQQPEYRVPVHPAPPYMPFPHHLSQNLPFRTYPQMHSPHLPPPPPYPLARSPPRPVPRSPVRPVPCHSSPYSRINFHLTGPYTNGYPPLSNPPITNQEPIRPVPHHPKRQISSEVKENPPVVAAIDLTVETPKKRHKWHCECGKTYTSDPVAQEVIVTVPGKVPTTYLRGKIVNGDNQKKKVEENGISKKNDEVPVKNKPPETKLPQLFLIKDLLAKGVRVEKRSSSNRIEEEICKNSTPAINKIDEKTKSTNNTRSVPIRTDSISRVIVSTGHSKPIEEPIRRKSHEYSVSNIIGTNHRRQSVDIDTISISSSSSESVRSPRPKSDSLDKQIPQGKLFYFKGNNSFIRYFEETQKKLFINNVIGDPNNCRADDREIIEMPRNTTFSNKDNLTVEEYVTEMTLVEKFIPKDFFLFYKFVTGYQICNNNLPVSFLTFLKVYNTNGLKVLFDRYVNSLK